MQTWRHTPETQYSTTRYRRTKSRVSPACSLAAPYQPSHPSTFVAGYAPGYASHPQTDAVIPTAVVLQPSPVVVQSARSNSRRLQENTSGLLFEQQDRALTKYGYPAGLRTAIIQSLKQNLTRIWVLDNSGSMSETDGSVLSTASKKMVRCSRWVELQDTMKFHLSVAKDLQAPCDLRLLNPGYNGEMIMSCSSNDPVKLRQEVTETSRVIQLSHPNSKTPLTWHILQIHDRIRREAQELRARGQRICVILATDGMPSDNPLNVRGGPKAAFRQALNSLHGLPVWVVIRLLTDDDDVIEYWNDLDQQVELSLEVLDDWKGEAREVFRPNPWLNYTKQLHHAREMGLQNPLFDLLDERPLGMGQLVQFMGLLFGEEAALTLPNPQIDLAGFLSGVKLHLRNTQPAFNILTKKIEPLVHLGRLETHAKRLMSHGECVIL